jgi:NodT family efflux transporter outer membrane factor (OMF) lipoprotein
MRDQMNYLKKSFLFFPLLLLSLSCVPKLKEPPELAVDVPQTWVSEEISPEGDISRWWTRFDDPGLNKVIDAVLMGNNDLKAAVARLDAALALARINGADLYPQVGASFGASRQKRNFVGFPIPGGSDGVLSTTTNLFGVSLDLSWEIDLWGRIRAGKAAAVADFQATSADLIGFQLSLAGQTAKSWYAAVEAELQVQLAEATLQSYRTSNDQVWLRYKRGLRPSVDVRLSETRVANAEAALAQRRNLLQAAKRQIETLLGRYPASQIELSVDLPGLKDQIPAGLPAEIIRRRPDLIAVERRLAASSFRLRESRRALYPRIGLTGSGGTSSNELKDLLDGDFAVWSLISNLFQPLFQGGRLRAGVDLARSRENEVLAFYVQNVINAFSEVETALSAEDYLKTREKFLKVAAKQSEAARILAEDRYARGLTNFIEVLEAQRQAFLAQSEFLRVKRLRLDNRIDLYLALGGDFIVNPPDLPSLGKEREDNEQ